MRSLNPVNVAGYLDAYINRTDLGLIRSLELPSIVEQRAKEKVLPSVPTAITVDTCLVSGSLATDLSRALADLNGRMDPRKTQFNLVRLSTVPNTIIALLNKSRIRSNDENSRLLSNSETFV